MKFLPKTVDSQFLVRVIRNEVSPEEREFFENWVEESEENKEEYSSLLLLWDKFQYSHLPSIPPQQEQWEKIESAINHPEHSEPESVNLSFPDILPGSVLSKSTGKNYHKNSAISWIYRVAAVLVIWISITFVFNSSEKSSSVVLKEKEVQQVPLKFYTLATGKGEKATMTLSDGSVIQLNSESRLVYPNIFGNDSREVEFAGEGYFKIQPNKKKPFRVNCNNTTTVVTGTEFNIKNRENNLSITVVEGSIKTFSASSSQGISVIKGEMVMLKPTGNFTRPVKADIQHFLAWRYNKLSFSKTPLTEAAAELQRSYSNLKFHIENDSIKQKTITGVFDKNSLDDILSIMSLTLDIRVTKKGNQIYFE